MISIILPYDTPGIGSGGPIQSIVGVCDFLKGNYEYQIITRNNNFENTAVEHSIANHNIVTVSKFNKKTLLPILNGSDIIWINSIYSIPFSFIPLITILFSKKTTLLISARGQLLSGSLNFKKRRYLQLYKVLLQLSRNQIYMHYATEEERAKSNNIFKNFKSLIFANPLRNTFSETVKQNKNASQYVIGFLGRVAPIKQIEFIIKLMPQLPEHMVFHIFGVIADNPYKTRLDKLITQLNLKGRVQFKGMYFYSELKEIYKQIDVAVVPSKSESFCYTFFEAIEYKTPVIASTGLPWKNVNEQVPNTLLPLQPELWIQRISEISATSENIKAERQKKLEQFYKFVATSVKEDILQSFKILTKQHAYEQ